MFLPKGISRISILILLGVSTFPFIAPAQDSDQDRSATLERFKAERQACIDLVLSGDVATALVETGSTLYFWRSYEDFPNLYDKLERAYRCLPRADAESLLDFRQAQQAQNFCGFQCFDMGIQAMAVGRYSEAAECFQRTLQDQDFSQNPFPHALRGRALLHEKKIAEATAAFEAAERAAAPYPAALFRVKFIAARELMRHGHIEVASQKFRDSLKSSYPLERAWALENLMQEGFYYQGLEGIEDYLTQLEDLRPSVAPRKDLRNEKRVLKEVDDHVKRARNALSGDTPSQMTLEVETSKFYFIEEDFAGLVARLEPWLAEFPIEENTTWDASYRKKGINLHLHTYAAKRLLGENEAAAEGFRKVLQHLSLELTLDQVVTALAWLGHSLREQGRLVEAKEAYERGLALDVANATEAVELGLPTDFFQTAVFGGAVSQIRRAGYVANYEFVLRAIAKAEEAGQ